MPHLQLVLLLLLVLLLVVLEVPAAPSLWASPLLVLAGVLGGGGARAGDPVDRRLVPGPDDGDLVLVVSHLHHCGLRRPEVTNFALLFQYDRKALRQGIPSSDINNKS